MSGVLYSKADDVSSAFLGPHTLSSRHSVNAFAATSSVSCVLGDTNSLNYFIPTIFVWASDANDVHATCAWWFILEMAWDILCWLQNTHSVD